MSAPLLLGVDPGLSGAVVLVTVNGSLHNVEDLPTMARGNGRVKCKVDAAALLRQLRTHAGEIAHGLVERVGA